MAQHSFSIIFGYSVDLFNGRMLFSEPKLKSYLLGSFFSMTGFSHLKVVFQKVSIEVIIKVYNDDSYFSG